MGKKQMHKKKEPLRHSLVGDYNLPLANRTTNRYGLSQTVPIAWLDLVLPFLKPRRLLIRPSFTSATGWGRPAGSGRGERKCSARTLGPLEGGVMNAVRPSEMPPPNPR